MDHKQDIENLAKSYKKDLFLLQTLYEEINYDYEKLQMMVINDDPATSWKSNEKSKPQQGNSKYGNSGPKESRPKPKNNGQKNNTEKKDGQPEKKEEKPENKENKIVTQKPEKTDLKIEKINFATGAVKSKQKPSFVNVPSVGWGELKTDGEVLLQTTPLPVPEKKQAPPAEPEKVEPKPEQKPVEEKQQPEKKEKPAPKEKKSNSKQNPVSEPAPQKRKEQKENQKNEQKENTKKENKKEQQKQNAEQKQETKEAPKEEAKPAPAKAAKQEIVPEKVESPKDNTKQPEPAKQNKRTLNFDEWHPSKPSTPAQPPVQTPQPEIKPQTQETKPVQGIGFDSVLSPKAPVPEPAPQKHFAQYQPPKQQEQAPVQQEKPQEKIAEPVYKHGKNPKLNFPGPRSNGPETILKLPIAVKEYTPKYNLFGTFAGPVQHQKQHNNLMLSTCNSEQRFKENSEKETQSEQAKHVDSFTSPQTTTSAQPAPQPAPQQQQMNQSQAMYNEFMNYCFWRQQQQMYTDFFRMQQMRPPMMNPTQPMQPPMQPMQQQMPINEQMFNEFMRMRQTYNPEGQK